jgi:oxygen-independent coproporphyrinogen-3 oxidase
MEDFSPTFSEDHGPIGVYVHIPFCLSRCDYCAFTTDRHDPEPEKRYIELLLREIDLCAELVQFGKPDFAVEADTLYLGGGTPSLIGVDLLVEVPEACRRALGLRDDAEITIEVNPATASRAGFRELHRTGFNRVSLGIQSFADHELRSMGRRHSAFEARQAFDDLRSAGFADISIDLLAGYPGQTMESVRANLHGAIELGPEHISIYLLETKEGTKLARDIDGGRLVPVDDDLAADMYEAFCEDAQAAGFEQYEISNFASAGHRCRHNLKYWRDEVFVGLGRGAHGMTGRIRYANLEAREEYERSIGQGRLPVGSVVELTPETRFKDALIMGLRLVEGVDLDLLGRRYRVDARAFVVETVGDLIESGLLHVGERRAFLTSSGRLLSNQVFSRWV